MHVVVGRENREDKVFPYKHPKHFSKWNVVVICAHFYAPNMHSFSSTQLIFFFLNELPGTRAKTIYCRKIQLNGIINSSSPECTFHILIFLHVLTSFLYVLHIIFFEIMYSIFNICILCLSLSLSLISPWKECKVGKDGEKMTATHKLCQKIWNM